MEDESEPLPAGGWSRTLPNIVGRVPQVSQVYASARIQVARAVLPPNSFVPRNLPLSPLLPLVLGPF